MFHTIAYLIVVNLKQLSCFPWSLTLDWLQVSYVRVWHRHIDAFCLASWHWLHECLVEGRDEFTESFCSYSISASLIFLVACSIQKLCIIMPTLMQHQCPCFFLNCIYKTGLQTLGSDAPWQFASVQTRSMTLPPVFFFKFTHTPDSDPGLLVVPLKSTLWSMFQFLLF